MTKKAEITDNEPITNEPKEDPITSIMFLKNVPHVLQEDQLTDFFNQFGNVVKCRVLRSKKTQKSRGIAWIKFAEQKVASIAVETMNNYLIAGYLLRCVLLKQSQVPPDVFAPYLCRTAETTISRNIRNNNKTSSSAALKHAKRRQKKILQNKINRLAAAGVTYSPLLSLDCVKTDDIKKIPDESLSLLDGTFSHPIAQSTPKQESTMYYTIQSTLESFCTAASGDSTINNESVNDVNTICKKKMKNQRKSDTKGRKAKRSIK